MNFIKLSYTDKNCEKPILPSSTILSALLIKINDSKYTQKYTNLITTMNCISIKKANKEKQRIELLKKKR